MVILGIDPSLTGTGCIKMEDGKIKVRQLIRTKPKTKSTKSELERLREIRDSIDIGSVTYAVIEGLAMSSRNSTALTQLSGLNYLIREYLYNNGIEFIVVPPTQLKKFVSGKGNCPKDLMLLNTYKRYHVSFEDDNLCDAYCLARVGEAFFGDAKVTQPQKEVVNSLKKQNYE